MDIRKPFKKTNEKIPVMFWIHGGSNTSGLKDIYDFSGLVKKENVIVVQLTIDLGRLVGFPILQFKVIKSVIKHQFMDCLT